MTAELPGAVPPTDVAARADATPPTDERPRVRRASSSVGFRRSVVVMVLVLVAGALTWEGFKWLAGDPWRLTAIGYVHFPPFHLLQAADLQLPHIWDIVGALFQPVQRSANQTLGQFLVGAALFTRAKPSSASRSAP